MPVKKISDAPANIRKLDGAKLTLGQINWILRVYDGLKEAGKVKNPMAVAISQFKKSFHKDGDKWVKNKGEGATMIDLERLDRYIVIPTGDKSPDDVEDLRELEGDFGSGVYPLFSDVEKSIVAFAFEKGLFTEEKAAAWVKKAMEPPTTASLIGNIHSALAPFGRLLSEVAGRFQEVVMAQESTLPPLSYEQKRDLVQAELEKKYYVQEPDGYVRTPWIIEMGDNSAVVRWDGQRYAVPYEIGEGNEVVLGDLEPVGQQWIHEDGSPVILHAFSVRLGDGDEAEDENDGLVWKELIHPGKWFKTNTGRLVEITADMIKSAYEAWAAGFPKYISVPDDSHHDDTGGVVPVANNRGFVSKLKLIGEKLFGGFKFTDPETSYAVMVGNVADVSVYLEPEVTHPDTGVKYDWCLRHVLLTNNPLVQDLEPFGAPVGANSGGAYVVETYQQKEVRDMAGNQQQRQGNDTVTLSSEEAATLTEFQGLGLSIDEIKAMQAERKQVRQKARGLEITRVVRAMEGVEQHDSVVAIDGFRHYPVVCAAVEKALQEIPQALGLTADENGVTAADQTILDVVNAIPDTGRMKVDLAEGPRAPKEKNDPTLEGKDEPPTDEQIKDFAGSLNPRRGSAVSV